MKEDIRSLIGDLHYPEQAPRYYLTYAEAVRMLVENVYRDEELHNIKAMQMMSVIDIMSFAAAFAVRILWRYYHQLLRHYLYYMIDCTKLNI